MILNNIDSAYVGADQAEKIYLGEDAIWENFVPYERQYLTIQALEIGTFNIRKADISYSINDGVWQTTTGATALSLNDDDTVRFKAVYTSGGTNAPGHKTFSGNTINFIAYGNVESLEYGDNFVGQLSVRKTFSNCFYGCSHLTDVSNLILPATSLADSCYLGMFYDCTGFTTSPVLPAPVVPYQAYRQMFYGCTSLNYIKCLATDISATDATYRMTRYVSSTGTFVKKAGVTWQTGVSGIPEGWTVIEE